MFRPITRPEELPVVGGREVLSCDFKAKPATLQFEMAKDVAAFANASGGTILIGATEERGQLTGYRPLGGSEVASAARAYEEAVRNRCKPAPMVDITSIRHGHGDLLAVNVWPMPATMVGVWVKGSKEDGFGDRAWVFPLRVGTQTVMIQPEQIPMFMLPKVRATVNLLSGLKKHEPMVLQYIVGRASGSNSDECEFLAVDPFANTLEVWLHGGPAHIPLDAIESVWRDKLGVMAAVRGSLQRVGPSHMKPVPLRWIFNE